MVAGDLPFGRQAALDSERPQNGAGETRPDTMALDLPYREAKERALSDFEAAYFRALLERSGGNVSEAARQAGLDRSNFRRAIKRAGLKTKDD
jgi:DNA-binding NtrC family response regulator